MNYSDDTFPFKKVLSLEPLIKQWLEYGESKEGFQKSLVDQILGAVTQFPELLKPIEDLSIIEEHRELVDMLISAVLPIGSVEGSYAAAIIPYTPIAFYTTPGFEKLNLIYHLIKYFESREDFMTAGKTLKAYSSIFSTFYDEQVFSKVPMFFPVKNDKTGLVRYFKIDFDIRLCNIVVNGELPALSEEEKEMLLNDRMNLDLWKSLLPPELFEFHGFGVLNAIEVTEGQIISHIQKDLLGKDALNSAAKIDVLQAHIRSLMRLPSLEMGLISVERGEFDSISSIQPLGKSLLLSRGVAPTCQMWSKSLYSDVTSELEKPTIIPDLERLEKKTGFEEYLLQQGYRSLLLAPLYSEDLLVGILELGSKNPHDLNVSSTVFLNEVTSLLAVAVHREIGEKEDRIQAIIKQQYTSIHPTVEWRFRDAAKHYLKELSETGNARAESIVFQNVYPLYGLSDIRGSSSERNASIKADLVEQLELAKHILTLCQRYRPLFAVEEIRFRTEKYIQDIRDELRSGDEITILQFLKDEVSVLFEELATFGPEVKEAIDAYTQELDGDIGVLYKRRKAYEESVRMVNDTIGNYIELQEKEAQTMYPHFFEMYKTDGVDYNIYVGKSLVKNRSYNDIYLHNLRLWQLRLMCGVHWEMQKQLPSMNVPLHTASLILVQNIPISIRFRIDEKKFDVDGAYNIRYEIVKKRIDKAVVHGSGERLTQPGKIAIVYSQQEEALEYKRYIKYLQATEFLEDEVEDLELGDMQGVYGLKALRVTVKEKAVRTDSFATLDEVIMSNGDGTYENVEISVGSEDPS